MKGSSFAMTLRSLLLASSLSGGAVVEVVDAQLPALGYAGIRGWWNACTLENELCANGELDLFLKPIFLDFDTCYSNPHLDGRGITFFGPDESTGGAMMYNIIITAAGDDAVTRYGSTNCDPQSTGACVCTGNPTLAAIRGKILQDAMCNDDGTVYKCDAALFEPTKAECWVPSTVTVGLLSDPNGEQFYCSMVASIDTYEHLDNPPVDDTPLVVKTPVPNPVTGTSTSPDDDPPGGDDPNVPNVYIPAFAHDTYCTAIMGWYDSCFEPRDDSTEDNMCIGASYSDLSEPLFVDTTSCYANPKLEEGRTVTFFGETLDKQRLLQFHMIFHNDSSTEAPNLKPLNCDSNGRCSCSVGLLALKDTMLANDGVCDNTFDYECLAENFYGDTDDCFVPSTYEFDSNDNGTQPIHCNMVAKVQQFQPCNTILAISEKAKETFCSGITGWYNACVNPVEDGQSICDNAALIMLDDPLFLDLETCYSNPNFPDHRAVSFYGKIADGTIRQFHIIAEPEAGEKYKPMNCLDNGACTCNQAVLDLKADFVASATCREGPDYTCAYDFFNGFEISGPEQCYVPGTQLLDEPGSLPDFTCSMMASIEHFRPCVKELAQQGLDPGDPNTFNPNKVPTLEGAEEAYCTAITGWYNGCTGLDPAGYECAGYDLTPINPLFLNFTACYANPAFSQRTVSFFGKSDTGDVKEFHLILRKDDLPYEPTQCDSNGACVCPQAIVDLKAAALEDHTACEVNDDIACKMESFGGDTEECWAPTSELVGSNFLCTMTARIQQFGPCAFHPPSESPTTTPAPSALGQTPNSPPDDVGQAVDEVKAKELDYTAITGWWNDCLAMDDSNANDPCEKGTNIRFEKPVYLNLETCYKNPQLGHPHYSVSFFLKDTNDQAYAYHLLFESDAVFQEYSPTSCTPHGECSCGSSPELYDLRESLLGAKDCANGIGYVCKREIFIGFSNDCYVPIQETFANGQTVCAMAASVEQIPFEEENTPALGEGAQGEAGSLKVPTDIGIFSNNQVVPDDGGTSRFPIWAIVVTIIAVLFVVSFTVLGAVRYKRRGHFGSSHGNNDEVRVCTGSHDSKFTRRALNTGTEEQSDGVWKRENMHDLKFKVFT